MLGYFMGQWCSDRYQRIGESSESPAESLRVVRGIGQKNTNLTHIWPKRGRAERLWNLLAETSLQQHHDGRSWTRIGLRESEYALVRLASDGPDD